MLIIGVHITKHLSPEIDPSLKLWWSGTRSAAGGNPGLGMPAAPDRSRDPNPRFG